MKILLIEPAKPISAVGGDDVFIFEPLALEYIAAGVSTEHDVKILDLRLDNHLETTLVDFRPDIVGITAYTIHVNVVKNLFEQIKAWDTNILTVVGGHHATVMPADFISPYIDLIVMGEGVYAFKEIAARYDREEGFDDIPGVIINQENSLVNTYEQLLINLDDLPFPDRSLTREYRQHYYSDWMKP